MKKKWILWIGVLLLSFFLVACGDTDPYEENEPQDDVIEEQEDVKEEQEDVNEEQEDVEQEEEELEDEEESTDV